MIEYSTGIQGERRTWRTCVENTRLGLKTVLVFSNTEDAPIGISGMSNKGHERSKTFRGKILDLCRRRWIVVKPLEGYVRRICRHFTRYCCWFVEINKILRRLIRCTKWRICFYETKDKKTAKVKKKAEVSRGKVSKKQATSFENISTELNLSNQKQEFCWKTEETSKLFDKRRCKRNGRQSSSTFCIICSLRAPVSKHDLCSFWKKDMLCFLLLVPDAIRSEKKKESQHNELWEKKQEETMLNFALTLDSQK